MHCPHCHIEIGGHVQVGSEAYSNVTKGLCPNCGCGTGFKIDFVAPSGRLMSDEKAFQKAQSEGAQIRDIKLTCIIIDAPKNHKKVGFHTTFGAIGLFIVFYLFAGSVYEPWMTIKNEELTFALAPFMCALIIAIMFRILAQLLTYWHYVKFVEGRESYHLYIEGHKNEKLIKNTLTNANLKVFFIVISWLLFIFGAFFLLALLT